MLIEIALLILGLILFIFLKKRSGSKKAVGIVTLILGALLFILVLPIALFIGVMATDDPSSSWGNFWLGFFLFEAIPTLIMIIGIIILVKRKRRKKEEGETVEN